MQMVYAWFSSIVPGSILLELKTRCLVFGFDSLIDLRQEFVLSSV